MSRFTPAPWSYKRASQTYTTILDIEGDGRLIAFTAANNEASAANARLIAAAPRLYAALGEYMACVAFATNPACANADVITLVEIQDRMTAAREEAEAALAEARGDQ